VVLLALFGDSAWVLVLGLVVVEVPLYSVLVVLVLFTDVLPVVLGVFVLDVFETVVAEVLVLVLLITVLVLGALLP